MVVDRATERPLRRLVARAAAIVGREVVQLQADAEEVPAHVHRRVRRRRIQRGRADRVSVLDHEGEVIGEAEPPSQRDEAGGGIGLDVGPAAGRSVERVPEASARIERVPALLHERGVELEEDLDAADVEGTRGGAVLVEHVADLDSAVQLVVGLVAEAEHEAGLEKRVLAASAVAAGRDLAGSAQQLDGPGSFLGGSGQSENTRYY